MKKAPKKLKPLNKAKIRDVMIRTQEKHHKEKQEIPPEIREKIAGTLQEVGDITDRIHEAIIPIVEDEYRSRTENRDEE